MVQVMESFQPLVLVYTARPTAKNTLSDDNPMPTGVNTQSNNSSQLAVTSVMATGHLEVSNDTDCKSW